MMRFDLFAQLTLQQISQICLYGVVVDIYDAFPLQLLREGDSQDSTGLPVSMNCVDQQIVSTIRAYRMLPMQRVCTKDLCSKALRYMIRSPSRIYITTDTPFRKPEYGSRQRADLAPGPICSCRNGATRKSVPASKPLRRRRFRVIRRVPWRTTSIHTLLRRTSVANINDQVNIIYGGQIKLWPMIQRERHSQTRRGSRAQSQGRWIPK